MVALINSKDRCQGLKNLYAGIAETCLFPPISPSLLENTFSSSNPKQGPQNPGSIISISGGGVPYAHSLLRLPS